MRQTATRCWRCAVPSIMARSTKYLCVIDSDYEKRQNDRMQGFWSLLRSWLRPHRGISQEKLPLYLGFFEFVHNVRKRSKALLGALIELLVSKDPGIQ